MARLLRHLWLSHSSWMLLFFLSLFFCLLFRLGSFYWHVSTLTDSFLSHVRSTDEHSSSLLQGFVLSFFLDFLLILRVSASLLTFPLERINHSYYKSRSDIAQICNIGLCFWCLPCLFGLFCFVFPSQSFVESRPSRTRSKELMFSQAVIPGKAPMLGPEAAVILCIGVCASPVFWTIICPANSIPWWV